MKKNLIHNLLLLISILVFPASGVFASMPGTWQRHPSFYQQTQQIIDGENATYFLLQQQKYDPRYEDYNVNVATLFVYDKSNENEGIQSLSSLYSVFPVAIRAIAYSPARGMLAAAADDGTIWMVPDGGVPFAIGTFGNATLPGRHHVNSLTENPADGSFWIAASFGYAKADPSSGMITNAVKTEYPIEYVVPVGEDLLIVSDGKVYSTKTDAFPVRLGSLTPLPVKVKDSLKHLVSNGTLASASNIMPLTSRSFAFIGPDASGKAARSLAVATKSGDAWEVILLGEDDMKTLAASETATLPTVATAAANRDGYYLQALKNSYQLLKGIDPDLTASDPSADFKNKALKVLKKTDDASLESASWRDGEYWFFTPKKGFVRKNIASDGNLREAGEYMWVEGPAPFISNGMSWHPTLGAIVSGHGIDNFFHQNSPAVPWLISAYKNGKWSQLSPVFHLPKEFTSDETFNKTLTSNIESYPVSYPDGLAIDPADPSFAYTGSMWSGWARLNLNNPSEVPLHVGSNVNSFAGTPGFVDGVPSFSAWRALCDFAAPAFDSKGNLWTVFYDVDKAIASKPSMVFYCYTAEDLAKMKDANKNGSSYVAPRTIEVPLEIGPQYTLRILPLKSSANSNIIAFHMGAFNSPLYLYDHNGTLADTSDDRFTSIYNPKDALDGRPMNMNNPVAIFEDPSTGNVWISTNNGTFLVDPSKAFDNPEKAASFLRLGSKSDVTTFETTCLTDGITDSAGNLWIASNNSGLACISADRSEILGEFNIANSPLTSNRIYKLLFNPERQSIMMSTGTGIMEFLPEMLEAAKSERVRVTPSQITPLTAGLVTFSGVPSGKTYYVTDETGDNVAEIGTPTAGTLHWNVENHDGKRPSTGRYELRDNSGEVYAVFHILN